MKQDRDWERIARYVAGECTGDEAVDTERWIAVDPARRELAQALQAIWAYAEVAPAGWAAEAAWRAVEERLDSAPRAPVATGRRAFAATLWADRTASGRRNVRVALAAASVVLALGVGLAYVILAARPDRGAASTQVATRTYVTPRGERAEFNLDDGTHVMLGVASRLGVPTDYGMRGRQVTLEGEAYFDVRHDPAHPFLVRSGGTVTRDIGTRFAVRAYPGDAAVQVVVAEGSVAVQGTQLTQGQLGRVVGGGRVAVESGVEVDRYLAWTQGRLVFDNTPLKDALPQLDRWYDLEFRLGDSVLAALPVTATFRNQPTDEVLDLLTLTLGLRQERQGRVVTLYRARSGR